MPSLQLSCKSQYHLCVSNVTSLNGRFLCCLSWDNGQTWYTACLVDGLQVWQSKWWQDESHVIYRCLKTWCPPTNFPRWFPPRCPDWVFQVAFRLKLSDTKFGVKWLKPEGVPMQNVLSFSCACAMPNPLFEVGWCATTFVACYGRC